MGGQGNEGDEGYGCHEGYEGNEEKGCHETPCHEGSSRGTSPHEEDEGHEGDEEEEGNEGHGCHEGHEGHEGYEEEGCYEAPCDEGSSRGTSSNEEDEGHEGDEEEEGHEGNEGHEVIQLYQYAEAMRCHAMKAKAPASMKGVKAMKAIKWQMMNDENSQHAKK